MSKRLYWFSIFFRHKTAPLNEAIFGWFVTTQKPREAVSSVIAVGGRNEVIGRDGTRAPKAGNRIALLELCVFLCRFRRFVVWSETNRNDSQRYRPRCSCWFGFVVDSVADGSHAPFHWFCSGGVDSYLAYFVQTIAC